MGSQRVVVITGMHRSGTSLVAGLIRHAGAMIGDRLLPANEGNPRGYFEDVEFLHFHEDLLRRQGLSALAADPTLLRPPSHRDARRARALLERRREHDLWGFKDPRASLFLDFWKSLLENDAYIFLYRRPVDVVLSLVRRGSDVAVLADPIIALEAWKTYNHRVVDFFTRHPERCVLCEFDGVVEDFDAFVSVVERKLDLPLDFAGAGELLAPEELGRVEEIPAMEDLLSWIDPQAIELLGELRRLADLRGRPRLAPSLRPAGEALLSLTAVVGAVGEDGALWQVVRGPLFALLLAMVPPEGNTSPASGQALRSRLLEHLSRTENIRLGDRLERLQRELDDRSRWTEEVEGRLRLTGARLVELQGEFNDRTKWAFELEALAEERQATVCELQAELAERRRRLLELDSRHAAQELRLRELEARLLVQESHAIETE